MFRPDSDFPQYNRTPGYPLLIAVVFSSVGESPVGLLIFQVAISTMTVYLAYRLASSMWTAEAGLLTAVLVTVEPLQFTYSGIVLTETLFALLVVSIAFVGYSLISSGPGPQRGFSIVGILILAATLVRPIAYYLPLVLVPLLSGAAWAKGVRRPSVVAAAAVALLTPVILGFGAWQWRNCEKVGDCRIAGIEAVNLYLYRGASALALAQGRSREEVRRELIDAIPMIEGESLYRIVNGYPIMPVASVGPVYQTMREEGVKLILEYPVQSAWLAFEGLGREILGVGPASVFPYFGIRNRPLGLILLASVGLMIFYALTGLGIFEISSSGQRFAHAFVLAIVAYFLLVAAGPEAESRFRMPMMPILSVYAAQGLWRLRGGQP